MADLNDDTYPAPAERATEERLGRATTGAPNGSLRETQSPERPAAMADPSVNELARDDREEAQGSAEPPGTGARSMDAGNGAGSEELLLRGVDDMRREWETVQVRFVDDPRGAVREADALVSSVIQELTASFHEQIAGLEAAWEHGEDASTDDLRGAFQTYRDFFNRLLAV